MISAWGNQTPHTDIRERKFGGQPTGTPQMVCRGAGGIVPAPNARNANTVPAFPPFPHKRATARHDLWRPRYPHLTKQRGRHRMRWPCDAMRNDFGPTRPTRARPTWPPGSAPKKNGLQAACVQSLYEIQNLYIHARASAARFAHNVTAAGQQPRQAPAAAIGWAAGWPCAWRAGVRAIGAAVGPAPSGRGPWGTVRGAALRRACGNRRPMDGQKLPRWPRAAGMFQPGKKNFFLDYAIK